MTQMADPSVLYCTDEDVAIRAPADYPVLVPKDQIRARGADGAFSSGDRWTLTSATVDFHAQGVAGGSCLLISNPSTLANVPFKTPEVLVAHAVSGMSCTLRRKGELGSGAGYGEPPGPIAGATALAFSAPTLRSQVVRASFEINRRFGIDDALVGRAPTDLYDADELRDLTVLTVLVRQYEGMAWQAGSANDHFSAQARNFKLELGDLLARLVVKWTPRAGTPPETTIFSTRIGRG